MIFLGADHAGFELKEAIKWMLENLNIEFQDMGASKFNVEDDYPDFAKFVCEQVQKSANAKGILICGTGQGMAIAANKFDGIRASLAWDEKTVKSATEHNNANVLCLGGQVISEKVGVELVKLWLKTKFSEGERHIRRIEKIKSFEN